MSGSHLKQDVDVALVTRLLDAQFPQWADLPIERVQSAGTDNAIYRLGMGMAIRLPLFQRVADHVEKEQRWLPKLAPFLPLPIPTPIGKGAPALGYPWHWSIYHWLEGEAIAVEQIVDPHQMALEIGQFIAALQHIDPTDGPDSGKQNEFRGVPLERKDADVRAAIATLQREYDVHTVTAAWEAALRAEPWHRPPVWVHGDLHAGNLLMNRGKLSAVIDFGLLGVGDPACDLMVAWTFLPALVRKDFRKAVSVDDATWARGRGWALYFGLVALAYYLHTNPTLSGIARQSIDAVLADQS